MTEGKYKIWAGQGQGNSIIGNADTLDAALSYVEAHKGHASFAIQYPDGTYHQWDVGLPTSMTKELIPLQHPVTYHVVATMKCAVSIDGYRGNNDAMREQAIAMIMEATGVTRDKILMTDMRISPRGDDPKGERLDFEALVRQPIYDPDPHRSRRELQERLVQVGRSARDLWLPADDPSGNFSDEFMRACWRTGWRHRDEELKGWRDPVTGLLTAAGIAADDARNKS